MPIKHVVEWGHGGNAISTIIIIIIIWLLIQGCLFSNKGAVINKGPVINIYNLRKT